MYREYTPLFEYTPPVTLYKRVYDAHVHVWGGFN